MDANIYVSKLIRLLKQQRILLPTVLVLSVAQLLSVIFLFCKKERVVLVPPLVTQVMWIDGYQVSQTYLHQMGLFMGQLLLSNSAESIKLQMDTILRFVHPAAYTTLRQYLIGEEEHLKKQQGSYHFNIQTAAIHLKSNSVTLTGDRESYVGGKRIDQARESYTLTFKMNHGRYLLTRCQKEEK